MKIAINWCRDQDYRFSTLVLYILCQIKLLPHSLHATIFPSTTSHLMFIHPSFHPSISSLITSDVVFYRDSDPTPNPPHYGSDIVRCTLEYLTHSHDNAKSLVTLLANNQVIVNVNYRLQSRFYDK